jgi:hypothetical protein
MQSGSSCRKRGRRGTALGGEGEKREQRVDRRAGRRATRRCPPPLSSLSLYLAHRRRPRRGAWRAGGGGRRPRLQRHRRRRPGGRGRLWEVRVGGGRGGRARRGRALRERWRRNQSSAASTMAPRPLSSRHQTHMHRGERQRAGRGARLEPSAGGAQAGRAHTRRTRSNAHRVMCGDAWRRPENHGGGRGAASTRMWRRSQRPPAHSPSPARRAARRPRAPYGQQLRECAVEGRRRQRRRKREWGRATLRWGLRAPAVSRASDPATP